MANFWDKDPVAGQGGASSLAGLKPLTTEDGENGYWDAKRMGNGQGRSFIMRNGVKTFISDEEMAKLRDTKSEAPAKKFWEADPEAKQAAPEPSMMDRLKEKAGEITAQTKQPFSESYASEALSGVNEGLASAMSVPAMLANSALTVGPTVVNAVTGTDFKGPNYIPDPGATAQSLMEMSGAIKPASEDPGKQVVRRIAKEVGAAVPFGMTRPIATVATALGSGAGAAAAQQIDPDNPWLELAGQFGGGAITGVLGTAAARLAAKTPLPKGKAPTADELQALKSEAYQVADGLGAKYSPKAYDTLVGKTEAAVKAGNISPTRHPKAWSFVEDMRKRASGQYGQGLTLTELDQLRQEVRRDLLQSSDLSERHFGGIIVDEIDDYIAKAGAGDMLSGDGKMASEAITAARELNTRWRKTELIEDALYAADLKTAAAGSGGNINNAIRTAFKSILLSEKKRRAFTAAEISEMERIVKQGKGEDLLRLVGKLSPGGNGLMTALGIGGTVLNPVMAIAPAAGMVAKTLADRGTVTKAANLRAKVAQGAAPRNTVVAPVPDMAAPSAAAAMGAAANQNDRTTAPVPPKYLRPTALN